MNHYFLLHAFVVILLYENGLCSDWSSSILEGNEESPHHVPVWARKAGFTNVVRQSGTPGVNLANPTEAPKEDNNKPKPSGSDPKWNRPEPVGERKYVPVSVEDSDVIDLDEDEERDCGDNHFWHIRGQRCVPLQCPGGNAWRNQENGECTLRRYKGRGRWRKRYNKQFSHTPNGRVVG